MTSYVCCPNDDFGDLCSILVFPHVVALFLVFGTSLGLGSAAISIKATASSPALLNQGCEQAASRELLWLQLNWVTHCREGPQAVLRIGEACLRWCCVTVEGWGTTTADRPARRGVRRDGIARLEAEIWAKRGIQKAVP